MEMETAVVTRIRLFETSDYRPELFIVPFLRGLEYRDNKTAETSPIAYAWT
jgi:hypothetical protein